MVWYIFEFECPKFVKQVRNKKLQPTKFGCTLSPLVPEPLQLVNNNTIRITFPRILHHILIASGIQSNPVHYFDSPTIFTANLGLLLGPVETFSIFLRVSIPSITFPNTTCFPSRKSHFAVVIKNWDNCRQSEITRDGFYESPNHLAAIGIGSRVCLCGKVSIRISKTKIKKNMWTIDSNPGPTCFSEKFSSWKGVSVLPSAGKCPFTHWKLVTVYREWPCPISL